MGKKSWRDYQTVSLTSIPGKVMELVILEAISIHMDDKKVIRSRQHGFTKGNDIYVHLSEGRKVAYLERVGPEHDEHGVQ
ncbi:hypothetical protein WISP_09619 [Willisornis vidua]|uniref:Reverse transcriptase domain-containing protein n=1 Tax=Willisornis vidua TaxID=1566151 RepID=A0ABQ9DRN2_9PASS|nr:hypothetical protein WISP_09619 [Willisornis vidua]